MTSCTTSCTGDHSSSPTMIVVVGGINIIPYYYYRSALSRSPFMACKLKILFRCNTTLPRALQWQEEERKFSRLVGIDETLVVDWFILYVC
jgi:hypothetical protein